LEWEILKQSNLEEKMEKKSKQDLDMWLEMKEPKMKLWSLLIS
jgi:hypothetical protein